MADLAARLTSETGTHADIVAADLTNANDLCWLERILREDSRVTLLLNNAGVGATAPLLESTVSDMTRMVALNVGVVTRYGGTKAFVLALSQSLRRELANTGVKVQVVLPGATATNFWNTAGRPVEHRGKLSCRPRRWWMRLWRASIKASL